MIDCSIDSQKKRMIEQQQYNRISGDKDDCCTHGI